MVMGSTAQVHYRTAKIDGLEIFYREAGPPNGPTLLLLHGFPTSSHMFRDLIPLLADRYHVVAPDYPGFGYSSTPSPREFDYTFDHLADVMEHFTDAIGLHEYALYLQDFGGPVGLRLAARHPDRVRALVIQNANAYEEGFSQGLRDIVLRAYTDHSPDVVARLRTFFELPVTKHQSVRMPGSTRSGEWIAPATRRSSSRCIPTTAATSNAMTSGIATLERTSRQPSSCGAKAMGCSWRPALTPTSET
jgi:pimeloyl-ACP methyl ester carboxylesterase